MKCPPTKQAKGDNSKKPKLIWPDKQKSDCVLVSFRIFINFFLLEDWDNKFNSDNNKKSFMKSKSEY